MDRHHLILDLRRDEGERLAVYDDATGEPIVQGSVVQGHPTIGIGRLLTDARGITKTESEILLSHDIDLAIRELDRAVPWWRNASEGRQRALANMAFNLGLTRLLKFKKTLAAYKEARWNDCALECLDSRWAKQVGPRAARIARLFREDG